MSAGPHAGNSKKSVWHNGKTYFSLFNDICSVLCVYEYTKQIFFLVHTSFSLGHAGFILFPKFPKWCQSLHGAITIKYPLANLLRHFLFYFWTPTRRRIVSQWTCSPSSAKADTSATFRKWKHLGTFVLSILLISSLSSTFWSFLTCFRNGDNLAILWSE